MGQILVRQLDDEAIARLKARAKSEGTSVEALAREAIQRAATLTVDEKLALAQRMQNWSRNAQVRGAQRTPGWKLIREDRDHDH